MQERGLKSRTYHLKNKKSIDEKMIFVMTREHMKSSQVYIFLSNALKLDQISDMKNFHED